MSDVDVERACAVHVDVDANFDIDVEIDIDVDMSQMLSGPQGRRYMAQERSPSGLIRQGGAAEGGPQQEDDQRGQQGSLEGQDDRADLQRLGQPSAPCRSRTAPLAARAHW